MQQTQLAPQSFFDVPRHVLFLAWHTPFLLLHFGVFCLLHFLLESFIFVCNRSCLSSLIIPVSSVSFIFELFSLLISKSSVMSDFGDMLFSWLSSTCVTVAASRRFNPARVS